MVRGTCGAGVVGATVNDAGAEEVTTGAGVAGVLAVVIDDIIGVIRFCC